MNLPMKASREVRYAIAGIWNSIFGIALFGLLLVTLQSKIGHLWVLTITTPITVVQSHFVQRRYVWQSNSKYHHELGRFISVYSGQYVANLALLYFLVDTLNFQVFPSQLVITGILIGVSFLINRNWTFAK